MAKRKKTLLKNTALTSVDFCGRGANQESNIALYKSTDEKGGERKLNFWERIGKAFGKVLEDEGILKQIAENANEPEEISPLDEADSITKAMGESLHSILSDESLTVDVRADLLKKSMDEFNSYVSKATRRWLMDEDEDPEDQPDYEDPEDDPEYEPEGDEGLEKAKKKPCKKSDEMEEDFDMATIDINKMSAEDRAILEELRKKYAPGDEGGNKPAEMAPEVKKALDEVAELRKSLEIRDMEANFQKYSVIGKQADKLAAELYDLKKSNESAYRSVIAAYDEMVKAYDASGIFKEYGTARSGGISADAGKVEVAAAELMKSDPSLTYAEAIVKACDADPLLKAAYEGQ